MSRENVEFVQAGCSSPGRLVATLICAGVASAVAASPALSARAVTPAFRGQAAPIQARATAPSAFGPLHGALFSAAGPHRRTGLLKRTGLAAGTATVVVGGRRLPTMADVPPDPTGAIGGRYYVEAANGRIAVYKRSSLRPVRQLDSNRFWHIYPFTTIDPQIAWDAQARRWYAAIMDKARDRLLFAWSKGADPRNLRRGWCHFRAPKTRGLFPDFPMLGFSRRHIVIGVNMGDPETHEVSFARIFVIAKPTRRASGCRRPAVSAFGSSKDPLRQADGRPAGTPVAAREVHPTGRAWVLAADCPTADSAAPGEDSCQHADPAVNQITVWRIEGSRDSPKLVEAGGVNVPPFRAPRPVPQPRTRNKIDPSDTRLSLAVSNRDPSLGGVEAVWVAHAVADSQGRAVIRWYELDPARLAVLRTGTVERARNWAIYPAISPTWSADEAVLNYVVAGPRLRPQVRVRYRAAGDPAGTMHRDVLLARSRGKMAGQCEQRLCRYGDYAGASPDPRRRNKVWGTQEFIGRQLRAPRGRNWPNWKTLNFAVRSGP